MKIAILLVLTGILTVSEVLAQVVPPQVVPATAAVDRLPELARQFGSLPEISKPAISPDGRYIAIVAPQRGVPRVLVRDAKTGNWNPVLGVTEGGYQIASCQWVKNDRLLCLLIANQRSFATVDYMLLSPDGQITKKVQRKLLGLRVINRLRNDPKHVAVTSVLQNDRLYLHKLDVYSGEIDTWIEGQEGVSTWVVSDDGTRAAGFGYLTEDESKPVLWTWTEQGSHFERRDDLPPNDKWLWLRGIDAAGRSLMFTRRDGDRVVLATLPFDGGGGLRTVISDDQYDIGDYNTQPGLTQQIGRAVYIRDKLTTYWFSPPLQAAQEKIEAATHDATVYVESMSESPARTIVSIGSDSIAPYYLLIDPAVSAPVLLGKAYSEIDSATLSPMRPVAYAARDGTRITGFLTEPKIKPAGPPRLVVMPHDGANARSVRGFHYIVQFLAARGYSVLQPNYRGSYGFGRQFFEAGRENWGQHMNEDIIDGVRWAIRQGLAAQGHVAIVGAGYGGYASLLAVAREPGLFRCAVSYGGLFDTKDRLLDFGDVRSEFDWRKLASKAAKERAELHAQSPLYLADQIRVPVLLVHGNEDPEFSVGASREMAAKLNRLGRNVELVVQKGADHDLSTEKYRIDYLQRLGAFLDANMQ